MVIGHAQLRIKSLGSRVEQIKFLCGHVSHFAPQKNIKHESARPGTLRFKPLNHQTLGFEFERGLGQLRFGEAVVDAQQRHAFCDLLAFLDQYFTDNAALEMLHNPVVGLGDHAATAPCHLVQHCHPRPDEKGGQPHGNSPNKHHVGFTRDGVRLALHRAGR